MPLNNAQTQKTLESLHLIGITLPFLDFEKLAFPNIKTLDISNSRFGTIGSLSVFSSLQTLYMQKCEIESFSKDLYQGLSQLKTIQASNYKLCCAQLLPRQMNLGNCLAPFDEISSCDNLLRSIGYRIFLWIFALTATFGL